MPWEATTPKDGLKEMNFYVYRAGGDTAYPLENVNAASLEGVMWYLHNEVVISVPRKYGIDRIRRYRVKVHNTQEFWNVHKRQFGPFFAYDAGRCTSLDHGTDICNETYHQYGFIVGCQTLSLDKAAYLSRINTTVSCTPGADACRAPQWFSFPGECPSKGIPQKSIQANVAYQDVEHYKSAECKRRMPGGLCDAATGAPDCTYSVIPAGEIFLDEIASIPNYNYFWNSSYEECVNELDTGVRVEACQKNFEYTEGLDQGTGNHFWDNRMDPQRCRERMDRVVSLFTQHYPDLPPVLESPPCDFDMYYDKEFTWPQNHDGAEPSKWWDYKDGGRIPDEVREALNTHRMH